MKPWLGLAAALLALGAAGTVALWPYLRSSMADTRSPLAPAPIDGQRAYGYLKAICALGPRPAGSEANTRQRQLVAEHFQKQGGVVTEQPFSARDPRSRQPVAMVNLIGSWFPERTERVVLAAHYDTRPFPDMEDDPAARKLPFLGANDGASGVALLMETAHHLATSPTPWGVDLVLLDGEELVYGREADINGYFLGSKEFGRRYAAARKTGKAKARYTAGLVLDMVGDKDLLIEQEQYSLSLAPDLVREVWSVADRLQARAFRTRVGQAVFDDHLALNNAGIPTIDLIDFDYPHWHTARDIPENCSGASLAQVGRVVTAWLAMPKKR